MKEQLNQMKGVGLAGTIFHPRYYTGRPSYMGKEYLGILSELILYAKEIGMEFDVTEERILEQHGELKDGKLWIGRGCYDMVIASEHGLFEQEERIAAMKDMGLWHTSVECSWQFAGIGKNQLMLEVFDEEIAIPCEGGFGELGIHCLEVWVSDSVSEIFIQGMPLPLHQNPEGAGVTASIPEEILEGCIWDMCRRIAQRYW